MLSAGPSFPFKICRTVFSPFFSKGKDGAGSNKKDY